MVTIAVLPALVLLLIAHKALSVRGKHRKISLFWELITLTPLLFLTYEAVKVALWSFQNIDSGNGSARAANGVVFIVLVTLMAIYGLILAVWVFPKIRFYLLILVFLGVGIIATAIAYDSYDYYKLSQRREVGGIPKSEIIEAATQLSGLPNPAKRSVFSACDFALNLSSSFGITFHI